MMRIFIFRCKMAWSVLRGRAIAMEQPTFFFGGNWFTSNAGTTSQITWSQS